jgi:hypothetical protein
VRRALHHLVCHPGRLVVRIESNFVSTSITAGTSAPAPIAGALINILKCVLAKHRLCSTLWPP